MASPSLAERLTAAFYDWEVRGRGWVSYPHRVALEPPFRPFLGHQALAGPVEDDGRRHTWLSALTERLSGRGLEVTDTVLPEEETETPEPFEREEPLREFEMRFPREERLDAGATLPWLASLATARGPLSFELIGYAGQVFPQVTCPESDARIVAGGLNAYFPAVTVVDSSGKLRYFWEESEGAFLGVMEFGLGREFMIPLNSPRGGPDPLIALAGPLARIPVPGIGVVQVLFEEVRAPWAESIARSVVTPSGEPFFADAPHVTALAREKLGSPLYAAVLRIAAKAESEEAVWEILRGLAGGFALFGSPDRNELIPLGAGDLDMLADDLLERTTHRSGMILSAEELISLVHLPADPLRIPGLLLEEEEAEEKPALPEEVLGGEGVALGEGDHKGEPATVTILTETRLKLLISLISL